MAASAHNDKTYRWRLNKLTAFAESGETHEKLPESESFRSIRSLQKLADQYNLPIEIVRLRPHETYMIRREA